MPNYKFSETAEADLVRIYHWDSRDTGMNKLICISTRSSIILNKSLSTHPVTEIREGYRRSVCGSDNVYYRIADGIVEIMAIVGAQDADQWV